MKYSNSTAIKHWTPARIANDAGISASDTVDCLLLSVRDDVVKAIEDGVEDANVVEHEIATSNYWNTTDQFFSDFLALRAWQVDLTEIDFHWNGSIMHVAQAAVTESIRRMVSVMLQACEVSD